MSIIRKAKRHNIPLKIGMSGPSGSGKTYGAILLAHGLMGSLDKVCILDTENQSADLYSDLGDYSVLTFAPPFAPSRYVKAIDYIIEQGFECIIIDSTSHEWDGSGGVLDIHGKMPGNSFTNWRKVNPMHDAFVNKILQSPINIICCMRRKQDYSMEKDASGKMTVTKMGLKEIQRDGFEYDLSVNFDIEINHTVTVSKDRTNLFNGVEPFVITPETGKLLRDWNNLK